MTQHAAEIVRADRVELASMLDAIAATAEMFVALLRGLAPGAGARPVPGLDWTVAETAAHVLGIVRRGTGDTRRADSVPGLAALNQQCVGEVSLRDLAALAGEVENEVGRLLGGMRRLDPAVAAATPVPLHAGVTATVPVALSYLLFELLVHGVDIAAGASTDWTIDPSAAALDLHACLPALGPWLKDEVRAGARQRLDLGFAGDADVVVVEVGEGGYRAWDEPRAGATAQVAEADPVETLLAIAGRAPATAAPVQRLADWFTPI